MSGDDPSVPPMVMAEGNGTDGSYPIDATDDLIAVSIWTTLLLYALTANIIIIVGILRNVSMRQSTSYWFIISLAVCDIVMIVISLGHIVPATYLHDAFLITDSTRNIVALFLYDLFWYTGVLKLGFMAFNRFASIIFPVTYKRWFSRSRTLWMIAGLYTAGLVVSLPTLFQCCHTLYYHHIWLSMYQKADTWYAWVDLGVNTVSVVMMICCYAVIVWKVHMNQRALSRYRSANSTTTNNAANRQTSEANGETDRLSSSNNPAAVARMSRREFRLFIQFFVVSLIFLTTWSTWQWLPYVQFSNQAFTKWTYFLLTTSFFLNNSVNPTVYLIFNNTLRHEVRNMLGLDYWLCCVCSRVNPSSPRTRASTPNSRNQSVFSRIGKHSVTARQTMVQHTTTCCASSSPSRPSRTRPGTTSSSSTDNPSSAHSQPVTHKPRLFAFRFRSKPSGENGVEAIQPRITISVPVDQETDEYTPAIKHIVTSKMQQVVAHQHQSQVEPHQVATADATQGSYVVDSGATEVATADASQVPDVVDSVATEVAIADTHNIVITSSDNTADSDSNIVCVSSTL